MENEYFIIDVETCPINLEEYQKLDEELQKKQMNPIDSRIVAIGIRYRDKNIIIFDEDEKKMLEDFWLEWKTIKKGSNFTRAVGFNIKDFDLPFLVTRSLINEVVISAFLVKEIIDLREKVSAYKYGPIRGTLKEYGKILGETIMDVDGSNVPELCIKKEFEKIKEYLGNDLKITDTLYKRMKATNILGIERW